jgi:hypothetical protein
MIYNYKGNDVQIKNLGSGSELYGVEPWNFYFKNLFLNFNFILLFSLIAPLVKFILN